MMERVAAGSNLARVACGVEQSVRYPRTEARIMAVRISDFAETGGFIDVARPCRHAPTRRPPI